MVCFSIADTLSFTIDGVFSNSTAIPLSLFLLPPEWWLDDPPLVPSENKEVAVADDDPLSEYPPAAVLPPDEATGMLGMRASFPVLLVPAVFNWVCLSISDARS